MQPTTLPTEEQRVALCDLMAIAFIELRYLNGDQAHDLAYAFHNLPKEIYGWGSWSVATTRARFLHYQTSSWNVSYQRSIDPLPSKLKAANQMVLFRVRLFGGVLSILGRTYTIRRIANPSN